MSCLCCLDIDLWVLYAASVYCAFAEHLLDVDVCVLVLDSRGEDRKCSSTGVIGWSMRWMSKWSRSRVEWWPGSKHEGRKLL